MEDPPEIVDTVASKHAFHWDTAAQLPTVTGINAMKSPEAKNAKIKEILADLQWRMHDALDSKTEIQRLRILNSEIAIRSAAPAAAAAAAPAAPAAPGGGEAVRINELEGQLQAANEKSRIQKEAWDAEKEVFAARAVEAENLVSAARAVVPDPGSAVAVQAVAGLTDDVDDLKDQINRQQGNIDFLTGRVQHWRDRYESETSSTHSNVLQDLLDQLQHVLRLSLDNPGRVYTAVAEAIYENTTPEQRDTIDHARSNKTDWIAHIAHVLQNEPDASDTSDSDTSESGTAEPGEDGIELAARPKGARTPRVERPESARAKNQNERQGFARRAFNSAINKVKSIRGDKKTDMSSLLSDLKHASEHGSSFTNNICSVDAELPPT
jgi:hypothetical protein